jgi:UDP-glucose 4-epimerase
MECAAGIRKKLEVFGDDYSTIDGTGVRDYIHVSDLARGHLDSIDYLFNKNKNLIINLGTGNGFSVLEVINATEKISNKSINYSISSRREGDPDTVIASAKKAEKLINWLPKKSDLENIISSTWEMYNK